MSSEILLSIIVNEYQNVGEYRWGVVKALAVLVGSGGGTGCSLRRLQGQRTVYLLQHAQLCVVPLQTTGQATPCRNERAEFEFKCEKPKYKYYYWGDL